MKTFYKYLTIAAFLCVAVAFNSCSPDYGNVENKLPVVTTYDVASITKTEAYCGGEVTSDGGFEVTDRGICWSTSSKPTMDDHYLSAGAGLGFYALYVTGLTMNTTYYVRAYACNENGVAYGAEKSFKTQGNIATWLKYDVEHEDCWGLTSGGDFEWAVRFPIGVIGQYYGASVKRIRFYCGYGSSTYTFKIYSGGTTSPSNLKRTMNKYISSTGWNTVDLDNPYTLNNDNSLWVSVDINHPAQTYPAGSSTGVDNVDARWYNPNSHGWLDMKEHNSSNDDVNWEIEVYVTESKNGNDETLIKLPLTVSE